VTIIRSEPDHRLSSNSRAVLQPNFRLYDRAALYTEANLILVLPAHRPRIGGDRRTSEMQYVCDAPNGKAWFRIETEGEAVHKSRLLSHTVEKYFRREREKAVQSWRPERPTVFKTAETPPQRIFSSRLHTGGRPCLLRE
jgi:hypothetical protein